MTNRPASIRIRIFPPTDARQICAYLRGVAHSRSQLRGMNQKARTRMWARIWCGFLASNAIDLTPQDVDQIRRVIRACGVAPP